MIIAQVQSGGSFDIDYQVTGPLDKVILDGTKERQGDFVFTAQSIGEYSFCFSNEMSTFAEKLVDFEIAVISTCPPEPNKRIAAANNTRKQVENEQKAELPSRQGASPEQASAVEESITKVSHLLSTISRNQKYFRTRENRNFSTVRSTERRIFNFSVIESLMMISMAGLQVFIVRFFFQGARKGEFFVLHFYMTEGWMLIRVISRLCMITRLRYMLYVWHQSMGHVLGF